MNEIEGLFPVPLLRARKLLDAGLVAALARQIRDARIGHRASQPVAPFRQHRVPPQPRVGRFHLPDDTRTAQAGPFSAGKRVMPGIEAGDMLLFPGYLQHEVPRNQDGQCVTLAFNAVPARLDSARAGSGGPGDWARTAPLRI